MNDLDAWLDSIGVTEGVTGNDETVEAIEHQEEPSEIVPQDLAESDIDDILQDNGFTQPFYSEAEEMPEEESRDEEEEENTDSSVPTATVASTLNYVGSDEPANVGDVFTDPNTGETRVLTEVGVQTIERNLDDEEDADWEERIESGDVVPVPQSEENSEGNQPNTHQSPQEDNVYFHMPNGEVITVPIIHEGEQELHELEQASVEAHQAVVETSSQSEPLLPLNSPTLLLDESTTRFSGAEWYNEIQKKSIIFGGIGGIGSNCCFQLARMKPAALFLYDDDMVEIVNMAGQLYARSDVGKSKVDAISDMITAYTNMQNIYAIKDKFTEATEAGDIMMCGFDNMAARKMFYRAWRNHLLQLPSDEWKKCLFLDGRLSMTDLQVFCLTGEDDANMRIYEEEYLFDDSEAEHTVCSMKQTTYLACMIGSIMTNLFTNWVANTIDPIIPYDLPFFTEYDAQNMIFKTIK